MKTTSVKRTLAMAFSAFALSGAFVGCTDYTEFSQEEIKLAEFNKQYDDEFVKLFGTPDPNHDWGFTELTPIQSLGGGLSTRAYSEGERVLVNKNEWTLRKDDDQSIPYHNRPYRENALAHDIQIPGWPHLNGLYYGSTGGGALEGAITASELDDKKSNWQPVGDVTEFEIQYVSAWFRTHKIDDPTKYRENLHLSDFFIQNISQDDDQTEYRDIEYSNIRIDFKASQADGSDVQWNKDVLATRFNGTNVGNLSNPGEWNAPNITRTNNSKESISYKLDYLGFKDMNNIWTHVNNFNNSNANVNPEESRNNPQREIKYVKSSGTEDFTCHASWGDKTCNNWVLVHLTWVETVKNENSPLKGTPIQREGYYLAFDFASSTQNTTVEGDHYYSNWIVKITPGHFNPDTDTAKRVMVEDLGGSFDFDFNDVVFDVAYDSKGGDAIISLQAAGGTMPIVIGHEGSDASPYEVHKLLAGNDAMDPINVGKAGVPNREVAIYRVPMTGTNLGDIKIYVKNTLNGGGTWKYYSGGSQTWLNLEKETYGDSKPTVDKGASEELRAPRAFAVPLLGRSTVQYEDGEIANPRNLETKWVKENKCIHNCYYEFDDWVQNGKPATGFGMDSSRAWWEQANNTADIFVKSIVTDSDNPASDGTSAPAVWIPLYPQTDHKCFADYYLTIDKYNGDDAIWRELVKESTKQITFTVVMESTSSTPVEAILIPADVKEENGTTTMSYQGKPFASFTSSDDKSKVTNVFTKWQKAVESENRYKEDGSKHTYVCRFSFTKEQFMTVAGASDHGVSSYFFLYIKAADGTTTTIPAHPSVNNKWQWYIHY